MSSAEQGKVARHPLLMDIDSESVLAAVQRLFDASEMVGMQSNGSKLMESDDSLSPVPISPHTRRASGIHLPRTLRQGDFGVERLGSVATLNFHRLIYRAPEVAWNTTTNHLLWIMGLSSAPQSIRVQAARVLDEILTVVPRNLSSTGDLQANRNRSLLASVQAHLSQPTSRNKHHADTTARKKRCCVSILISSTKTPRCP
ncbi:hypothetical protein DFJ58DRAFT_723616 [Suillus subalutaceus]|uniref:uncharacterized protein n=1 Tax=Suillus subalutaceus TaxID=48586 RepID=UPI001B860776|nr:uncharacterized protein DFJ58DRAFT_723616 [Suillus subalutaceus]KAG1868357.1 hypothetical protein DFJ58DRAFT_723616 [Suillus subalutaceus]